MNNFSVFSIILWVSVTINDYDSFIRTVWVNIHGEDMQASATEASYHVANAIASALYEALLFVLANPRNNHAVSTLDVEVRAEASTHTATLSRTAFPMDTAVETDPEPAAICAYSPEVERYIYRFLDDVRADISEMLKALTTAHFEDTDGGEGNGYAVTRRSLTPEP